VRNQVVHDGNVGADTEVTNGIIRFQEHKLFIHPSTTRMSCHLSQLASSPYRVVVAGAGDFDYVKQAVDETRNLVCASGHSIEEMSGAVRTAVDHVHEIIFRNWTSDNQNRPQVFLVVGLRNGEETKLLRTWDTAISEIETCSFSGSGKSLARYLATGLYRSRCPSAVGSNMLVQIFRAVKEPGAGVGGNTELCILGRGTAFHVPSKNTGFLWGLQSKLHRAVRTCLGDPKGQDERVKHWANDVREALLSLRCERNESSDTPYEDFWTVEGNMDADDPLEDVW
jgi:hypothetical protein